MSDYRKYIIAFVITAAIFTTAVLASSILAQRKIDDVRAIGNRITLDILSSETQYALLEETSCRDIAPGFLSKELGELGEKLAYAENNTGFKEEDIESLKRSYFLLEIKDYLLMKRLTEKCNIEPAFILYFYSTEDKCEDCTRMGYVLTALRNEYPDLRVYSFDYHFDLEAIKTLLSIYKIKGELPALFIDDKTLYGFHSIEELEEEAPILKTLRIRAENLKSSATSTDDDL